MQLYHLFKCRELNWRIQVSIPQLIPYEPL